MNKKQDEVKKNELDNYSEDDVEDECHQFDILNG